MDNIKNKLSGLFWNYYFRVTAGLIVNFAIFALVSLLLYILHDYELKIVMNLISIAGVGLIIYWVLWINKHWNNLTSKDIGLDFISFPKGFLLGVSFVFAVFGICVWFTYLYGKYYLGEEMFLFYIVQEINWRVAGAAIATWLLVGFWEEIVFRGYLLNTFLQKYSTLIAILASSIIFTTIHLPYRGINWSWITSGMSISVILSYLYLYSKTLWTPICLHWFWNLIQGMVYSSMTGFGGFNMSVNWQGTHATFIMFTLLFLAILLILISFKIKPVFPFSKNKDLGDPDSPEPGPTVASA